MFYLMEFLRYGSREDRFLANPLQPGSADTPPPRRGALTACDTILRRRASTAPSRAIGSQRLQELHLMIVLDKANRVTAATTAVAVEQALTRVHQEAGL